MQIKYSNVKTAADNNPAKTVEPVSIEIKFTTENTNTEHNVHTNIQYNISTILYITISKVNLCNSKIIPINIIGHIIIINPVIKLVIYNLFFPFIN